MDENEVSREPPAGPAKAEIAAEARTLLRSRRSTALATALASNGGWPYASLVTVAFDTDASPILLLSDLSDHTRNLAADARAGLLFEDASRLDNPQTGPRLTLLGRIVPDEEPRLRRRFLARHPKAELYAGFADFRIFRMTAERAHWVGGFARARWLQAADVLADPAAARAIAAAETAVLAQMNEDHAVALDLYATRLLGRDGTGWRLAAIDPDGCDLARDGTLARLPFPRLAGDAASLRAIFVELAGEARRRA